MLKYESQIKRALRNIAMERSSYKGYNYVIFCTNYLMEEMENGENKPLVTDAYRMCAKKYDSANKNKPNTKQNVERAIRTFREHSSYEYKKIFKTQDTNTSFLYNIITLVKERDNEMENVFSTLNRISKKDDLYFLLYDNKGFVTQYDVEKTATIMNVHIKSEKDLIEFAANKCHGIKKMYMSSELTPEDFLKYNQKYLAIRFCTREFDISIVEAKNLVESALGEETYE